MAGVAGTSETAGYRHSSESDGRGLPFHFSNRRASSEIEGLSTNAEPSSNNTKQLASRKMSDTVLQMVSGLPYQVYLELVHCLNAPTANHNDWKTLAARLGLTTDEVLSFDEEGKRTAAVLHYMSDSDMETSELVRHLVAMERHDALSILSENGVRLNSDEPARPWPATGGKRPQVFLGTRRSLSSDELLVQKAAFSNQQADAKCKGTFHNRSTQWTLKTERVDEVRETTSTSSSPTMMSKRGAMLDDVERYALVFGIGRYTLPDLQLALPERDATAVADKLTELHWQVELMVNCSHQQMHCAITEFCKRVQNHVAMIYYSGHAVQINGTNYLLPADIPTIGSPATVMHHSIDLSLVLEGLSDSLMKLVIVHAGHPLPRWPGLVGLASMTSSPRTCVVFSTPPGHTSHILASAVHTMSPFASAFVKSLAVPDVPLRKVLAALCQSMADARGTVPPLAVFGQGMCQLPLLVNSRLKHGVDGVVRVGHAPPGHALIIGNSTYKACTLDHPSCDCALLAESLRSQRWTVECLTDLSGKNLTAAICSFMSKLHVLQVTGGAVMVVFCGYATQTEDSMFMMGTDLTTHCQEDELPWLPAAVSVEWLLDLLAETACGPKVLCLDVCWDCKLLPAVHRVDMLPVPAGCLVALSQPSPPKTAQLTSRLSTGLAEVLTNLPNCSLLSAFHALKGCQVESELFFA